MNFLNTRIRTAAEKMLAVQKPGPLLRLLLAPFTLAAFLFRGIVWSRRVLYAKGLFKSHRLPYTVISIGNITVGGTGKTPAVYYIARHLKNAGIQVAVLSRGYRSTEKQPVLIVSDGQKLLASPEQAGDEAFMLAQKLPGIPVLAGKDRVLLGTLAVRDFATQVALLDDGFQYYKLHRDLDIVLINARDPFGNGFLLPRGTLREPLSALARASIILLTKTEASTDPASLHQAIKKRNPAARIFRSSVVARAVHNVSTNETLSFNDIKGKQVIGLCSIGDPGSFFSVLESLGLRVLGKLIFPDHHWYGEADYKNINMHSGSVNFIITTEKDVAKIDLNMIDSNKLCVLEIELKIEDDAEFLKSISACSGFSLT